MDVSDQAVAVGEEDIKVLGEIQLHQDILCLVGEKEEKEIDVGYHGLGNAHIDIVGFREELHEL